MASRQGKFQVSEALSMKAEPFSTLEISHIENVRQNIRGWSKLQLFEMFDRANPGLCARDTFQKLLSQTPERRIRAQPHHRTTLAKAFSWTAEEFAGLLKTGEVPSHRSMDRSRPVQDLELDGDDAEAKLQICGNFIRFIDRLILDPQADGIIVTDLTGMATGFSNWNNDTCYQAIFSKFSKYAREHRKKQGCRRPGVLRSFFVNPSILDGAGLENLRTILQKHVLNGIGAKVVILGSRVPAEIIGDIGVYHGTIADEFFNLERTDNADPGPQADVIDRAADLTRFKEIEERLKWVEDCRNGSVLNVAHDGGVQDCLSELARLAKIKFPQESRET
jgi:hypothetical protein